MENFLDISKIMAHLSVLERPSIFDRDSHQWIYFQPIYLNGFEVEIGAGIGSFSEPYSDLDKITYYKTVQVSVYEIIKGEKTVIKPGVDERFRNFVWSKHFVHVDKNGNRKESYIGDRVPLNEVCQMIREIYKISRLKLFY